MKEVVVTREKSGNASLKNCPRGSLHFALKNVFRINIIVVTAVAVVAVIVAVVTVVMVMSLNMESKL